VARRRLEGRVAVVTGAASGIGRATASLMAAEGASVVVADLDGSGAGAVAVAIVAAGGRAIPVEVDVSEEAAVADMIAAAVGKFGRLDVLHNNAAALGADVFDHDRDIVGLDVEVWDRTMAVNARGVLLGCKHAIPRMLDGGGGAIVNMSSGAAWAAATTAAAYGASKAAVGALTAYVATMYGKQGIRCNAVAPGLVMTEAAQRRLSDDQRQMFLDVHLTPDLASPEDLARAVVFLASDDAAYVTGQTVVVDGGMFVHSPTYRPPAARSSTSAQEA
jgi:NAD(P)-dependent dehydrogenase (short-subunit alcohol dehydrogenase family)